MTDKNDNILDRYLNPKTSNNVLMKKHASENSGHRMFCPDCHSFQRALITFVPGGMLRIQCKVCNKYSDFVIRREGYVPEQFGRLVLAYAKARVRGFFGEKKNAQN